MNKKTLAIGSIIACIIILLASLSPVVGYNSARSSVRDSPLFSVRSQRAIDKEEDALRCDYIGKDKENILFFSDRWTRSAVIQKFINSIEQMDENEFERFIELIIKHASQKGIINHRSIPKLITAFYQLKYNPELLKNYIFEDRNMLTVNCTVNGEWVFGCGFRLLASLIFLVLSSIWFWIIDTMGVPSCVMTCEPSICYKRC